MKKLLTILLLPSMFASSTCMFTSAGRTGGSASGKNKASNHRAYAPRRTDAAARRNHFRRLPQENEMPGVQNVNMIDEIMIEKIMRLPENILDITVAAMVTWGLSPELFELYHSLPSVDEKRAYILTFVNFGMTVINDFIDNDNSDESSDED